MGINVFGILTTAFTVPFLIGTQISNDDVLLGPSRMKLETIKVAVDDARAKISNISVQLLSKSGDSDGSYLRIEFAANALGSYFHDSAKGNKHQRWQDCPFRQTAYVKSNSIVNVYPYERSYFQKPIKPNDTLPGSHKNSFFFLATGIWPFKNRQPPKQESGRAIMLFDVFNDLAKLRLRPDIEVIENRPCVVVENSKTDLIYLDVERNYCLVKRELHDEKSGRLLQRFTIEENQKIEPGIWLPKIIRNQLFEAEIEKPMGKGKSILDSRTQVTSIEINKQMHDKRFGFTPPPGSVQLNHENRFEQPKQVVPGGLDHLAYIATWIKKRTPPAPPIIRDGTSQRERINQFWFVVPLVFLILANETRLWRIRHQSTGTTN